MILYKNKKWFAHLMVMDFFDIITEVLQGDTLVLYVLIICQDNILQTLIDLIKENNFTQKSQAADNNL